jgi:hypothetical protein
MNSRPFASLTTQGTPLAMNGRDCPKFESPVLENVTQISDFDNRWLRLAIGDND